MYEDQQEISPGERPAAAARWAPSGVSFSDGPLSAIPLGRILNAVRGRVLLVLAVTAFTTTFALVAFRQPSLYRATAVLRLAGERRALAAGMEEVPTPDRFTTPLNSLVPRVLSRTIIGAVVDSLGLQLRPVPTPLLLRPPAEPALRMTNVRVDASTPADTLMLMFSTDDVTVQYGGKARQHAYGEKITAGPAQFIVPGPPAITHALVAVLPRDIAIDRVRDQLAVVPLPSTDALEVRYLDTNPTRAQQVTNRIIQTFFASIINSSQTQARRRREFLEGRLRETERVLAEANGSLSNFRSRRRLASSSEQATRQQAEMMDLDSRSDELQADRQVFRSLRYRLETLDDSARANELRTLAYSPEFAGDVVVGKVLQQLVTYRTRLDSLTTGPWKNAATNPDLVQLRQLVQTSEGELVRAIRARLGAIDERLAALSDRRSKTSNRVAALPILEAEEAGLGQKVIGLSDFEKQLRVEYEKSQISEALAAGDIEIVDLAPLPYLPVGVPRWLKVALALVLGLVVALGLAVLLEMRNRSIRDPEELQRLLHLRELAVIPPVARSISVLPGRRPSNGKRLSNVTAARDSIGIEAFRLLYGSLRSTSGRGRRPKTILVTSVGPREGKTLIASNLAATYAREGARVLLIDCDLRRPRLHKMFRVSRSPGVVEAFGMESTGSPPYSPSSEEAQRMDQSALLRSYSMAAGVERLEVGGQVGTASETPSKLSSVPDPNSREGTPTEVGGSKRWVAGIVATAVNRLSLLPCGTMPPNAAAVLKAGEFQSLLDSIAGDFDVFMLDTSPVLVSADAVILSQLADAVLMVIRAGKTNREAAERAYQQLIDAGAHVVGAVLNDPEGRVGRDRDYGYAYDYPATED